MEDGGETLREKRFVALFVSDKGWVNTLGDRACNCVAEAEALGLATARAYGSKGSFFGVFEMKTLVKVPVPADPAPIKYDLAEEDPLS